MNVGLLSDVHGNYVGLNVCLTFFAKRRVEKIFFLGDAVGYLPDPRKAIDLLIAADAKCLLGNHDAMALGYLEIDEGKEEVYKISATRKLLYNHRQQITASLPYLQMEINRKRILLVHGSPWDTINGYVYPTSDIHGFAQLPFDAVFMGHTHRPFIRQAGNVMVVNVGSCGLPRDQGNLASCAVYDSISGQCELFRIPFNVEPILKQTENLIHESVVRCFLRKTKTKIVGQII